MMLIPGSYASGSLHCPCGFFQSSFKGVEIAFFQDVFDVSHFLRVQVNVNLRLRGKKAEFLSSTICESAGCTRL